MKNLTIAILLITSIFFVSCGGDDITPNGNGKPPFNRPELLGKKVGNMKVTMSPGNHEAYYTNAEVWFSVSDKNSEQLDVVIIAPDEVTGITVASGFQTVNQNYVFTVDAYTPNTLELTENSIPKFIKEWYPKNTISKVILGKQECDDAKYSKEAASISMSFTSKLKIYDGDINILGEGVSVTYSYSNLVDKK